MKASELLKRYAAGERSFRGADLRGADLRGADLRHANLVGANLRGAVLRGADLRNADLIEADLCYADLRNADLCYADLYGADLRNADMIHANIYGADLRNADLSHANLGMVDLSVARLIGANMDGADLTGADLDIIDACSPSDGVKSEKGKPQWGLLPFRAIREVVRVITWASTRTKPAPYDPGSWHGVETWRYVDALYRHLDTYLDPDQGDIDEESGIHTMAHAVANCLFILYQELTGVASKHR